ncbi:hypothetical protein [Candidatus Tisiphia endosymbiont of Mystacides longicornis]|uniref:hypothetical protein n=1 Tax=Candidatus Tisiphia endosymbiont of Mystacides longicornis TaxID=3139330 RepID=UPI003CCAF71A
MIYYNKIGDDGVQALAKTLKINHSLTTLDLYNSQIGDAGAQAIAEALKDNHSITTLYLHTNQIGDAGAQAVAEALKVNYTINYLHIRSNQIGDAGAQAIAEALKVNKSITSFYIDRGNPIGSVGVKYLADALKINKSIVTFGTAFNNIGNIVKKEIETALQINNELAAKTKQETLAKQAAEQARQKEAERLEKEAKLREQEAAEQARQEALAKQIAEQTRQKEAERLEKEAKLREQEAAEQARQEALVKKYIAEQVRQQEAERVKQQAKLREQEEAKAAKEAAELKAIEEAKIKEYIPNIPAVKLFEVAGRDNQFDNDDQATIQQVSDLMRDGNDHLQENVKKAVLVVGKTGAGKSTLVHVLSGNELQAIRDDATSELVIDAIQPLSDIVIGHKMSSETKIPNKCLAKDLTIWDCPGFNDTDLVQEIANIFYIKRLFEITDQLKFVLVVDESDLRSNRGSDFLETLSNFIKSLYTCSKTA